jgi:hypothetical protein
MLNFPDVGRLLVRDKHVRVSTENDRSDLYTGGRRLVSYSDSEAAAEVRTKAKRLRTERRNDLEVEPEA